MHVKWRSRGWAKKAAVALGIGIGALAPSLCAETARAEGRIVVAQQFGIGYLPLHVIRDKKLIEKHGKSVGLEITVDWKRLSGGAAINDALLSGAVDIGSGGVAPLLTLWDRTRGTLDVKAIAALTNSPIYLLSSNPNVKSLRDLSPSDRIALPSVKVSVQARTLQIAVEKEFGSGATEKLDNLTISLPHPEATKSVIAGGTEISAHFSAPPYQYQELEAPGVHKLLSSYDVLGGPSTFLLAWTTSKFRSENPKTYAAFVAALREAVDIINADKTAAAGTFIRVEESKLAPGFIERIVMDPEVSYGLQPANTEIYARFLHRIGALKNKASSWKDYFFDDIQNLPGS